MTEAANALPARTRIETRLARRYRAERRFRAYGLAAVGVAVAGLVLLVGSIVVQAYSAFWTYTLTLDVHIDPARIPGEMTDPDALRRADYGVMLQDAMRAEFPRETEAGRVRQILGLYTRLNAGALARRVNRDPALAGQTVRFAMPIGDEVDRYLKGHATHREWIPLSGAASIAGGAAGPDGEAAPVRVTLAAADAARIAEAAEADTLNSGTRAAILLADGGAWRFTQLGGAAAAEELLAPDPAASAGEARVLVLHTPEANRRISDLQAAATEILRERGEVHVAFTTQLFTNADSREPELAGVAAALIGSVLTMLVTMTLAVPIGIATAIYLEEFAPKNRWTDLVEVNINNLAAVPSIVFGLLGLAVFINFFGMPRSAPLLGGLVLALMTLPVVIIASRAALKAVPPSIREAALAVGASRTQAVFGHVLPLAAPGVLTGAIIGLARAMGETAPLLMIGMVAFVADVPKGITSPSTVMPVQVFIWGTSAERAFEARTAAAIVILLALMILMNAAAIFLRRKFERRW